ncbi:hypothetical protein AWJ20_4442 [Sugiyamaella lignohabitans]|uniref:J domain-containing protein n=1 Tax=Sugiyamaella lignohabitans TaxID=796027 RepID=A0A161HG15_9ASCO|nr:uncharacterized protein AWJ20_4442 [Sugiyamaella lignohabitans]ANB11621.1 hypothetical protein AWJ20_4442 [Sugiyamaella lignohabitans]
MAKIYHPDSNSHLGETENKVRADRFKKLVEAYDILKNDNKRLAYNNRMAAEARSRHHHRYSPQSARTTSSSSHPHMTDNFYTRGFHEGYEDEASRRMNDQKFQEQLKENRFKLAILLGIAVSLVAALQLAAIFKLAEKNQEKLDYATWTAEMENIRARSNYNLGNSADDRVSRFLAARNSSGYYDNYRNKPLALPEPRSEK